MKYRFIALLLLICANSAYSLETFAPSEAEIAQLPPFCAKKLKRQMSPQEDALYANIDHYCFGLNFINRAARSGDQTSRSFNLTSAKGEISYSIKNLAKGHWLLPQLYTDLGRAHLKLKEGDQAVRAFGQALKLNNAYEPAYRGLIDSFRAAGSPSSVLDVARSGLRYLPESSYLKKVYLESGGKEPFPQPVVKSEGTAQKKAPQDSPVQESKGNLQDDPTEAPPEHERASETEPAADASENRDVDRACRFCPPEEINRRWRESFESAPKQ